jgi:hypothetical protein
MHPKNCRLPRIKIKFLKKKKKPERNGKNIDPHRGCFYFLAVEKNLIG